MTMTRSVRLLLAVLLCGWCVAGDLLACGEKFLIPGRGTRFQRTPAERKTSGLLVLSSPSSELSQALGKLNIDASLRKAGYTPTVLTNVADLDATLPLRRWDVLVVDLTEIGAVKSRLMRTNPSLVVLPVGQKLTGVQLSQARAEFPVVLKAPTRAQDFLDAIDDALACVRVK